MALVFLGIFVLGVLSVSIWVIMKPESSDASLEPRTSSLEGRATNLEVRADNLETDVGTLHTTANQSLAYLRKMNSTVDVITDGLSLAVPDDPILSLMEERPQQRGPRGVSREFHF